MASLGLPLDHFLQWSLFNTCTSGTGHLTEKTGQVLPSWLTGRQSGNIPRGLDKVGLLQGSITEQCHVREPPHFMSSALARATLSTHLPPG